ncbi:MAG: HEPN domain protein [Euryarchaeota archaeon ADurb.Bin294]|nr:MAG: HEPN domain protein [Euryarchaeota archaeon ADurb.Bin294]
MKNREIVKDWMTRAESNHYRARLGRVTEKILFEDLCYDCQQTAEKSLKGLLIALDIESPRTHNIGNLFRLLHNAGVFIPQPVLAGSALTEYAVNTRYPGDYDPVSEEDYENALLMAEEVFSWVRSKLSTLDGRNLYPDS